MCSSLKLAHKEQHDHEAEAVFTGGSTVLGLRVPYPGILSPLRGYCSVTGCGSPCFGSRQRLRQAYGQSLQFPSHCPLLLSPDNFSTPVSASIPSGVRRALYNGILAKKKLGPRHIQSLRVTAGLMNRSGKR